MLIGCNPTHPPEIRVDGVDLLRAEESWLPMAPTATKLRYHQLSQTSACANGDQLPVVIPEQRESAWAKSKAPTPGM